MLLYLPSSFISTPTHQHIPCLKQPIHHHLLPPPPCNPVIAHLKLPITCRKCCLRIARRAVHHSLLPTRRPAVVASSVRSDVSPHRAFAVVRLLRIEQGGAYADTLNGEGQHAWEREMNYVERTLGFRTQHPESRSQRLVTEVVAGVTRWRRYLDFLIFSYYEGKNYEQMEPLLRQILRLGVYELVKLEMPPHAAVNEAVNLGKAVLHSGAGKLLNGLLRKVSSNQKAGTLPLPSMEGGERAQARAYGTIYSHPVWMVRRWVARFGKQHAINLMEWNNKSPTYSLRANSARGVSREDLIQRLGQLEVPYNLSTYLPDFVRLTTGMQAVIQAGLIEGGFCAVQDESAGMVVALLGPQPGDTIVDCCAAPGGKALFIASCLKGPGKLVAIDIHHSRLYALEKAAEVLGVASVISTYCSDLRKFAAQNAFRADKVLLDAPCSGLGVLSKRADLRWRRVLEDFEELTALQTELLDAAALLVKPGGVLVYSTCSIEPDENENRVMNFLKEHPDFMVESAKHYLPEQLVTKDGFYASLPYKHHIDGAFAARLYRRLL